MQTRYKPIAIVAVLLGVLGVVGYLTPGSTEQVPTRFLFENAGGKIVFPHKVHAEGYQIPCLQCHHESDKPAQKPAACAECHPKHFEEGFAAEHKKVIDKQYCGRCHHAELGKNKFDHEGHKDLTSGCLDCHHDKSVEPEPTSCGECRPAQWGEGMPSLRDATHKRCAELPRGPVRPEGEGLHELPRHDQERDRLSGLRFLSFRFEETPDSHQA